MVNQNPEKYEHLKRGRALRRDYVQGLKEEGQCVECGHGDDRALHFVHTRGVKTGRYEVDTLTSEAVSWPRLKEAIAKSDLLCLNCRERRKHRPTKDGH